MASTLAIAAGAAATAAYLDAKHLIRRDLTSAPIRNGPTAALKFVEEQVKKDELLMYYVLEEQALRKHPNNVCIVFEGRSWTYRQFFDAIIRVGNWLLKDLDVQKGEIVALDGGNSPEYIMIWHALESIGACPALINCNLSGKALEHCVLLSEARYLLADSDMKDLVRPSETVFESSNLSTIYYDPSIIASFTDITPLPEERRKNIDPYSLRTLIYTSGTTGLPKATRLPSVRDIVTSHFVPLWIDLKPSDKMYTCLPLYHGAAHTLCVNSCFSVGATVVLSRRFSHRKFWAEVRDSGATAIQYVGELCRYLVNAPPSPDDKNHKVRMAWGNGLRPDVWEVFRERFDIPVIAELYAATDGLGFSYNMNRGAFSRNCIATRGLLWHLLAGSYETRVKIDPDTQEIVRDKNGFAIKAPTGEPGEEIYWLPPEMVEARFSGYHKNEAASQKRLVQDVFKKGDQWFRGGDLMREDAQGRLYFVDRLGDTFRWKSENVSTNEVADVVGTYPQIAECNAYGVEIPHADGRCGAAAVVLANGASPDSLDLQGLAQHVLKALPRYAAPVFLRVTPAIDYTGNMKMQKGKLKKEGANLDIVEGNDAIFWLPPWSETYMPYEKNDWESLKSKKAQL